MAFLLGRVRFPLWSLPLLCHLVADIIRPLNRLSFHWPFLVFCQCIPPFSPWESLSFSLSCCVSPDPPLSFFSQKPQTWGFWFVVSPIGPKLGLFIPSFPSPYLSQMTRTRHLPLFWSVAKNIFPPLDTANIPDR